MPRSADGRARARTLDDDVLFTAVVVCHGITLPEHPAPELFGSNPQQRFATFA